MKISISIILTIFIFLVACATEPIQPQLATGDLTPKSSGEIVKHTYYSLAYSEEHEQAEWVYYILTPDMIAGNVSRKDDFREDPLVSTGSAQLKDYVGSGYDRGHLCPAASMSLNATSMSESFYMSNMSPQHPSMNRGRWKSLESQVRDWVNDTLIVASGPIFKDNFGAIGDNEVTVPGFYYKVIYAPSNANMIAFIMPNQKMDNGIEYYVVTVDMVENETGIDFFPGLDDTVEDKLESHSDFTVWGAGVKSAVVKTQKETTGSTQCLGVTQSGSRCKNKTKNTNGYCSRHQNQVK